MTDSARLKREATLDKEREDLERIKMVEAKGADCVCVSWLWWYTELGNRRFYDDAFPDGEKPIPQNGSTKQTICDSCKLRIDGHGAWCEFC